MGFETDDNEEVEATIVRLEPTGVVDRVERDESCCYAKKSTVWSSDPQGLRSDRELEDEIVGGPSPDPRPCAPR